MINLNKIPEGSNNETVNLELTRLREEIKFTCLEFIQLFSDKKTAEEFFHIVGFHNEAYEICYGATNKKTTIDVPIALNELKNYFVNFFMISIQSDYCFNNRLNFLKEFSDKFLESGNISINEKDLSFFTKKIDFLLKLSSSKQQLFISLLSEDSRIKLCSYKITSSLENGTEFNFNKLCKAYGIEFNSIRNQSIDTLHDYVLRAVFSPAKIPLPIVALKELAKDDRNEVVQNLKESLVKKLSSIQNIKEFYASYTEIIKFFTSINLPSKKEIDEKLVPSLITSWKHYKDIGDISTASYLNENFHLFRVMLEASPDGQEKIKETILNIFHNNFSSIEYDLEHHKCIICSNTAKFLISLSDDVFEKIYHGTELNEGMLKIDLEVLGNTLEIQSLNLLLKQYKQLINRPEFAIFIKEFNSSNLLNNTESENILVEKDGVQYQVFVNNENEIELKHNLKDELPRRCIITNSGFIVIFNEMRFISSTIPQIITSEADKFHLALIDFFKKIKAEDAIQVAHEMIQTCCLKNENILQGVISNDDLMSYVVEKRLSLIDIHRLSLDMRAMLVKVSRDKLPLLCEMLSNADLKSMSSESRLEVCSIIAEGKNFIDYISNPEIVYFALNGLCTYSDIENMSDLTRGKLIELYSKIEASPKKSQLIKVFNQFYSKLKVESITKYCEILLAEKDFDWQDSDIVFMHLKGKFPLRIVEHFTNLDENCNFDTDAIKKLQKIIDCVPQELFNITDFKINIKKFLNELESQFDENVLHFIGQYAEGDIPLKTIFELYHYKYNSSEEQLKQLSYILSKDNKRSLLLEINQSATQLLQFIDYYFEFISYYKNLEINKIIQDVIKNRESVLKVAENEIFTNSNIVFKEFTGFSFQDKTTREKFLKTADFEILSYFQQIYKEYGIAFSSEKLSKMKKIIYDEIDSNSSGSTSVLTLDNLESCCKFVSNILNAVKDPNDLTPLDYDQLLILQNKVSGNNLQFEEQYKNLSPYFSLQDRFNLIHQNEKQRCNIVFFLNNYLAKRGEEELKNLLQENEFETIQFSYIAGLWGVDKNVLSSELNPNLIIKEVNGSIKIVTKNNREDTKEIKNLLQKLVENKWPNLFAEQGLDIGGSEQYKLKLNSDNLDLLYFLLELDKDPVKSKLQLSQNGKLNLKDCLSSILATTNHDKENIAIFISFIKILSTYEKLLKKDATKFSEKTLQEITRAHEELVTMFTNSNESIPINKKQYLALLVDIITKKSKLDTLLHYPPKKINLPYYGYSCMAPSSEGTYFLRILGEYWGINLENECINTNYQKERIITLLEADEDSFGGFFRQLLKENPKFLRMWTSIRGNSNVHQCFKIIEDAYNCKITINYSEISHLFDNNNITAFISGILSFYPFKELNRIYKKFYKVENIIFNALKLGDGYIQTVLKYADFGLLRLGNDFSSSDDNIKFFQEFIDNGIYSYVQSEQELYQELTKFFYQHNKDEFPFMLRLLCLNFSLEDLNNFCTDIPEIKDCVTELEYLKNYGYCKRNLRYVIQSLDAGILELIPYFKQHGALELLNEINTSLIEFGRIHKANYKESSQNYFLSAIKSVYSAKNYKELYNSLLESILPKNFPNDCLDIVDVNKIDFGHCIFDSLKTPSYKQLLSLIEVFGANYKLSFVDKLLCASNSLVRKSVLSKIRDENVKFCNRSAFF